MASMTPGLAAKTTIGARAKDPKAGMRVPVAKQWMDLLRDLREADDDDHFYGAWHGGSRAEGGGPALATAEPESMDPVGVAMTEVGRGLLGRTTERLVVFDDSGAVLMERDGTNEGVDVYFRDRFDYPQAHWMHNHPVDTPLPFSPNDLYAGMGTNAASIAVVGKNLETKQDVMLRLHRPKDGWPQDMADASQQFHYRAMARVSEIMESDRFREVLREASFASLGKNPYEDMGVINWVNGRAFMEATRWWSVEYGAELEEVAL